MAAAVAEPALAEADAEPFDSNGGGDAELLPGGADAFGAEGEAVGPDAVAVAVEVVDAFVFGVRPGFNGSRAVWLGEDAHVKYVGWRPRAVGAPSTLH